MSRLRLLAVVAASILSGWAAVAALPKDSVSEADRARARADAFDRQAREASSRENRARFAAASLAARVQATEAGLREAQRQQAAIAAERRRLDAVLARKRAPTMRLMTALGSLSRRPPALLLLQPASLSDMARMRAITAAIAPQVEQRTAAIRAEVAKSEKLAEDASAMARRQAALGKDLADRRRAMLAAAAAERLAANRAAGAADREAERAFAIAEQARSLDTLSRRLQAPVSAKPAERPADMPRLLPPVSAPRAARASGSKAGASYRTDAGALAIAPGDGRVLFAGPYRGYGAIVIIDHGAGWISLVTGLSRSEVRTGQALVAGSPLGESAGGRVDWELRRGSLAVDPVPATAP